VIKMYVLAIGGGRHKGNTDQFLQKALDIIAEYAIDTELIPLATKHIEMDPCSRCPSDCTVRPAVCVTKDDFNDIFKKMLKADGIILGSPVYWGAAPAKLKEVLNRAGILSEGRVSKELPVSILGNAHGWPDDIKGRGWPETTKGPGLFARKIGGAISVAQRDGVLFTLSELCLWLLINDFVICSSNYWVDGLEQVGRSAGGVGGGGTRMPSKDSKTAEHVRDILQVDREAALTLEHFAENFAWLVTTTHSKRGTPKEIFFQSRLSAPPWMSMDKRKQIFNEKD
jgi:multimeric flavodoxin WrbA